VSVLDVEKIIEESLADAFERASEPQPEDLAAVPVFLSNENGKDREAIGIMWVRREEIERVRQKGNVIDLASELSETGHKFNDENFHLGTMAQIIDVGLPGNWTGSKPQFVDSNSVLYLEKKGRPKGVPESDFCGKPWLERFMIFKKKRA
jgi:hypothetical protein